MEDTAKARWDWKRNDTLRCPDAGSDGQQHKAMGTDFASPRAALPVPQPDGTQPCLGLPARLLSVCSSSRGRDGGRKAWSNAGGGKEGWEASRVKSYAPGKARADGGVASC